METETNMDIIARRPIIFFSADEATYGPFWNNEHVILGIILHSFLPDGAPDDNGIANYSGNPAGDKHITRVFSKRTFEPEYLTVGPGWVSRHGLPPEESTKTVKTITWRGIDPPTYHEIARVPPMMRALYTNK
jgi:hypothetical protein